MSSFLMPRLAISLFALQQVFVPAGAGWICENIVFVLDSGGSAVSCTVVVSKLQTSAAGTCSTVALRTVGRKSPDGDDPFDPLDWGAGITVWALCEVAVNGLKAGCAKIIVAGKDKLMTGKEMCDKMDGDGKKAEAYLTNFIANSTSAKWQNIRVDNKRMHLDTENQHDDLAECANEKLMFRLSWAGILMFAAVCGVVHVRSLLNKDVSSEAYHPMLL